MNNLYFNNKDLWNDFNCGFLKGIQYPTVEEVINILPSEGNSFGDLTERTGIYKDLVQEVKVRMFGLDNYRMRIALIEDWLSDIEDNRLFFAESLERCLRVKTARINGGITKNGNNCLEFTLIFNCEPFYFDSDVRVIEWRKRTVLKSDTMIPYKPTIELKATTSRTTITINGQELAFDTKNGETYIIDCEREYVYKKGTNIPIRTIGNFFTVNKGVNNFTDGTNDTIKIHLNNKYRG